jgi:hypothetical protein
MGFEIHAFDTDALSWRRLWGRHESRGNQLTPFRRVPCLNRSDHLDKVFSLDVLWTPVLVSLCLFCVLKSLVNIYNESLIVSRLVLEIEQPFQIFY